MFKKTFARAEGKEKNTFFDNLMSSWDVLPYFYLSKEKQHALSECHFKSVMNIITNSFDIAASEKKIWHNRGSPNLCVETLKIYR